ncbi:hypothetical protein AVEN_93188-1 [Araneus ventricosus]|uniref:Protein kinase domain-containing protein n=1 Tax=Araneus ventricosus TaxID=182803 RepID=A0A4Y2K1I8_ARAVE|nr:hypothetical protein AVEN_93188-1 [Araneus ventricosus]
MRLKVVTNLMRLKVVTNLMRLNISGYEKGFRLFKKFQVTQRPLMQQAKLEFPRDQLTLEETLGEGEFGKVVKGKAKNISGMPGTTTVAVKMLKDGSSPSERRDLVSELNLLKEISHPNVIRLLGASTDDGK